MNRTGRYKLSSQFEDISPSDLSTLYSLNTAVSIHESGGSYDMVASWVKGSHYVTGLNRLNRSASTIDKSYPDICGVHAELDIWRKASHLKGGTIYIAGKRSASKTIMDNTRPCIYCSAILIEAKVRYAVFYADSIPRKMRVTNLLDGMDNDSHID